MRTVLLLRAKPGRSDQVAELFRRHDVLERALRIDGCESAELWSELDGDTLLATAVWVDPEAYERWVRQPERAETSEALSELLVEDLASDTRGMRFGLCHAARPEPDPYGPRRAHDETD